MNIDYLVLAHIIQNKQNAMEAAKSIRAEYFEVRNQWLYTAIMEHFTNPSIKELPTINVIREYLETHYTKDDFIARGLKLSNGVLKLSVDPQEFTWHLNKLRLKYNKKLHKTCTDEIAKVSKDTQNEEERIIKTNDVLRASLTEIESIHRKAAYKEGSLDNSAKERVARYEAVEKNPELAQGILTGISDFDRVTNGLHGGELILIGGQTGTGKSVLMHNIAVNAWLEGYNPLNTAPDQDATIKGNNILYFSIEMSKDMQERRLDACMADIPSNSIRDGKLSEEEKDKYFKVLEFQKKYSKKFHIVDMPREVTTREIELKHLELEDKYNIKWDMVVADYLGVMKANTQQNSDWLNLGIISEEMHEYARTYDIPVLSAVQLNRPKDPTKQEHSTNRVARSDMIPTNANVILQIGCRGEDEHTRMDMPIYGVKIRDGEKTSFTLIKNFAHMKVTNMDDETFAEDDEDDAL